MHMPTSLFPDFAHLRSSSDKYQVLRGHSIDDTMSTDTSYIQALTYFEQRQKVAEAFSLLNEMFVSFFVFKTW